MAAIQSYGVAFPALRLAASAYREAWGQCSARGLKRKPFCAFDEDAVTLAIAAARRALDGAGELTDIGAIFIGSTNLPYEEKPSTATLATALFAHRALRIVEIRGGRQAGLQALVAAADYVDRHPEKRALAVAADAPGADPATPYEHALGAGAAAFVVGAAEGVADLTGDAAVTVETFGGRFRRHGRADLQDLELRVDDDRRSLDALAQSLDIAPVGRVATGATVDLAERAAKRFGGAPDGLWPDLGDVGAAGAAIALAHCLDHAADKERILAIAVGGGATALSFAATGAGRGRADVVSALQGGVEVDYLSYLKHKKALGAGSRALG